MCDVCVRCVWATCVCDVCVRCVCVCDVCVRCVCVVCVCGAGLVFGQYSRDDGVLIIATRSGRLHFKILRRSADFSLCVCDHALRRFVLGFA